MTTTTTSSESVQELAFWALEVLGISLQRQGDLYRGRVPLEQRDSFGGREQIAFARHLESVSQETSSELDCLSLDSPLLDSLLTALRAKGPVTHARPRLQPQSVRDVASLLLPAYKVQGGHVHLGGCSLSDRPFLRLSYLPPAQADGGLRHVFLEPTGEIVPPHMVARLQLDSIHPFTSRPPRLADDEVDRWLRSGRRLAQAEQGEGDDAEPLLATVVWCKYVEGKLLFSVGDEAEELSFAAWGNELSPRPLLCRHSGVPTFELASTDDGRIVAASQIETCALTQRRVLRNELVECSATGRHVLPEHAVVCPVVQRPVLKTELDQCALCQQRVSRLCLTGGVCGGCRSLAPVAKSDPRMARLLGEHPGLDRWRNWKLAETGAVYIAVATGLARRLLVVVEKQTLEPRWLALGNRLLPGWKPLSESALEEQLR